MPTNAEQALISAMIRTGDHLTARAKGVTAKLFHAYDEEFEWLEGYVTLHRRTPSREAFKRKFPQFMLKKYDDVEHLCDEVRDSHVRNGLSDAVQDVITMLKEGRVSQALGAMHTSSLSLQSQLAGMGGDSDIIQNPDEIYKEVARRKAQFEKLGQAGLPTGFATLNDLTGGPQPGHLGIIAARLGHGKTWALARMSYAACIAGFNIQYDTLEQTRAEIALRIHTLASSQHGHQLFKNMDLSQGRVSSMREYKKFLEELRDKNFGRFNIADTGKGGVTPTTIDAQIERNKPDVLFLDYLTLMTTTNGQDDWKSIAGISAALKQSAQRYQIPIVAAAQLNRSGTMVGKDDLAQPETLAESDAIGRDADFIVSMRQISKRVMLMGLVKNRHGKSGVNWYCRFLPNTGMFEEVTYDEAMGLKDEDKDIADDEQIAASARSKNPKSFKEISNKPAARPRRVVIKK